MFTNGARVTNCSKLFVLFSFLSRALFAIYIRLSQKIVGKVIPEVDEDKTSQTNLQQKFNIKSIFFVILVQWLTVREI